MDIISRIKKSIDSLASDVHITEGRVYKERIDGLLTSSDDDFIVTKSDFDCLCQTLMLELKDDAYSIDCARNIDGARLRINMYQSMHGRELSIRVLSDNIPNINTLGLPEQIAALCSCNKGLILIAGTTGSGKTTTAVSLLNEMNKDRRAHIMAIEDPIEYLFEEKLCKISQREVGTHVSSFKDAVKDAMREDPDIILLGEMREKETIQIGITLAETGHLVLATVHARNVAEVSDRIVDVFEASQQGQILSQFGNVLIAVIHQTLVKKRGRGRYCLTEVLVLDDSTRNLIKNSKDINSIRNAMKGKDYCDTIEESAVRGVLQEEVDVKEMFLYLTESDKQVIRTRIEAGGVDTSGAK